MSSDQKYQRFRIREGSPLHAVVTHFKDGDGESLQSAIHRLLIHHYYPKVLMSQSGNESAELELNLAKSIIFLEHELEQFKLLQRQLFPGSTREATDGDTQELLSQSEHDDPESSPPKTPSTTFEF